MIASSQIPLSELDLGRMDAEFYHPRLISLSRSISANPNISIRRTGATLDCSAFYPSIVPHYSFNQEGIPFLRVNEIQDGLLSIDEKTAFLPKRILDLNRSTMALCEPGDLIIAKGGNSLGKVALLTNRYPLYSACRDVIIVRTQSLSKINRCFLWMYLHSAPGQSLLIRTASQTGQPHLTIESIARLRIPLVSEFEQDKIASNYFAAETAVEKSRGLYNQARELLESELGLDTMNFEKPVGFTARFSDLEVSRRSDAQHYQPRFTSLLKHLQSFELAKLRGLRTVNRRGTQPLYVKEGDISVVNSQHLGPQQIAYDGLEKTSKQHFLASPVAHILPNDLLVYTTGAYIGRTNVYLDHAPALASNHVNIIRLQPEIDAAYMGLVMQSIVGQFQTLKYARGSAQAELYPSDIDKFIVPLLGSGLQNKIGDLVRESLIRQRESKRLLEEAKARVEQLIEEAVNS